MDNVFASRAVECGLGPRSSQTKDYEIGIYCFSGKHATLRRNNKIVLLGIRIMCPSGTTCLSVDCCFSEQAL